MKGTNIYSIESLKNWDTDKQVLKDGVYKYVPARAIGYTDWYSRLKIAWKVFKGEADAVTWD